MWMGSCYEMSISMRDIHGILLGNEILVEDQWDVSTLTWYVALKMVSQEKWWLNNGRTGVPYFDNKPNSFGFRGGRWGSQYPDQFGKAVNMFETYQKDSKKGNGINDDRENPRYPSQKQVQWTHLNW